MHTTCIVYVCICVYDTSIRKRMANLCIDSLVLLSLRHFLIYNICLFHSYLCAWILVCIQQYLRIVLHRFRFISEIFFSSFLIRGDYDLRRGFKTRWCSTVCSVHSLSNKFVRVCIEMKCQIHNALNFSLAET